jgi:DNA-binding transcriptional regulator GbsR (MarR family)
VHALLFLAPGPLHAERIADVLQVARSNVSTSLKELQGLNLVRTVHLLGDRRDHFETSQDVWELMRTVVRERKAREFDPTIGVLADFLADPAMAAESPEVRKRIADTHGLMQAMSSWGEQMLRLEPATLVKVMKLGAKIQKLLQQTRRSERGGLSAHAVRGRRLSALPRGNGRPDRARCGGLPSPARCQRGRFQRCRG